MATSEQWGTDVLASMPVPLVKAIDAPSVDMGGFVFTENGLAHNITQVDLEEVYQPRYMPPPTGAGLDG